MRLNKNDNTSLNIGLIVLRCNSKTNKKKPFKPNLKSEYRYLNYISALYLEKAL